MTNAPIGYKKVENRSTLIDGDDLAVWNPSENIWEMVTFRKEIKTTISKEYSRNHEREKKLLESMDFQVSQGRVYKKIVQR